MMMTTGEILATLALLTGAFFFLAGTIGLLRFPDLYTRLHAITKAENIGLGFLSLGLVILSDSWAEALRVILVWILVVLASATNAHLIAQSAERRRIRPWQP